MGAEARTDPIETLIVLRGWSGRVLGGVGCVSSNCFLLATRSKRAPADVVDASYGLNGMFHWRKDHIRVRCCDIVTTCCARAVQRGESTLKGRSAFFRMPYIRNSYSYPIGLLLRAKTPLEL